MTHAILINLGVAALLRSHRKEEAEAARHRYLLEEGVDWNRPLEVEAETVVEQRPVAGSNCSKQHSSGSRHKQHKDHLRVDSHSTERIAQRSLPATRPLPVLA